MTEKEQIENLANDVYIFYRNLGSAQQKHLTKSQIFRNFNLNNSNSSGVFKRSEELGVVFAINVPKMKQNEVFENPLFKEVITNNLPLIRFSKKMASVKKEPTIITGSSLSNGKHGYYIDPFPDELQNSENLQKASLKEIKKDDDEQETFKF
ncbi:MAG TPA: hypothetical protein PLH46_01060 [Caldisericia bacterium]|nr:hypothetical protein [Caldisericia bacterium]